MSFLSIGTLSRTGKGYKHKIWQEDVVSYCKEEFEYVNKIFTSSLSKGDKTFSQLNPRVVRLWISSYNPGRIS